MNLGKKVTAEFFGTFWLVFGGCGSAVLAATFPNTGIGFLGVALAFGLTVLTMVYAIGHISGCHLNPAVSVGLAIGKRFPFSDLLPYIVAQVLGGAVGAGVLISSPAAKTASALPVVSPPTVMAYIRPADIRWWPASWPRSSSRSSSW